MSTFPSYKRPALHRQAFDFAAAYLERYSGESLRTLAASKFSLAQKRAALIDTKVLSQEELDAALALPDRSDLSEGTHAVGLMAQRVIEDLQAYVGVQAKVQRTSPLISPRDNYLNLGFDPAAVARDRKHANYVSDELMLRTHMSSSAPAIARAYAATAAEVEDDLFALPGRVFRRDVADRTHLAHPHQLDLWRFSSKQTFTKHTVQAMVAQIVHSILPGAKWRLIPGSHPYTNGARQIDVWFEGQWLEVGECGLNNGKFYDISGLPRTWSSMVIGIGLERAVMLRKQVSDIRFVDSNDEDILREMRTLNPTPPEALRKNRFVQHLRVPLGISEDLETTGDAARVILGPHARYLESLRIKPVGGGMKELQVTLSSFNSELGSAEAADLFGMLRESLPHAERILA
jgi:phenylalanyl-tRNA synthetase alpha chain